MPKRGLVWRVPQWARGGWVEPVDDAFRQRFGDAAAGVVELVRDMVRDHRDQPSAQDIKHSLRRIAEAPAAADLSRLDSHTDCLLSTQAWRRFRVQRIEALRPEQVARCARAALEEFRSRGGRPPSDTLALMLVRDLLLTLPPNTPAQERDRLLSEALMRCGLCFTPDNLRRLLAKAGRFSH